jgi:transposase
MRRPTQLKPWMSPEELAAWVRNAATKQDYQKRLAIWLTHMGLFHAHQIAEMLQVSRQAVWLWLGQYNRNGPAGLSRQGRGGRRWGLLSIEEEQSVIEQWQAALGRGDEITAQALRGIIEQVAGRSVSIDYVYRLMRRNRQRDIKRVSSINRVSSESAPTAPETSSSDPESQA